MYKIINSADKADIMIYSLIEGGITASKLLHSLNGIDPASPITLHINSDGGEAFEAIALYNVLKERNMNVIVEGICASAASIVAMAGKHILMKKGSMMMIHNPIMQVRGDSEALKDAASVMDKLTESMADIYSERTGLDREQVVALMSAESYMTPEEAVRMKFADEAETGNFSSLSEYIDSLPNGQSPQAVAQGLITASRDSAQAEALMEGVLSAAVRMAVNGGGSETSSGYEDGVRTERERILSQPGFRALNDYMTPLAQGMTAKDVTSYIVARLNERGGRDKALDLISPVIEDAANIILESREAPAPAPAPAQSSGYEEGVQAERERIRALDELMAPGREIIINEAKYISRRTAQETAVDILKAEAARSRTEPRINGFSAPDKTIEGIKAFEDTITRKRG